jgi:hypothetical protein
VGDAEDAKRMLAELIIELTDRKTPGVTTQ